MKITVRPEWVLAVSVVLFGPGGVSVCNAQTTEQTQTTASPMSSAAPSVPSSESQFQLRNRRYEIEPGDSFDITFELTPEFNQSAVAVQPDGFVTLHGVGDIKVEGQTVPELTDTLRKAYSKILNDPIISVVLKDFQRPYFIADGQVGHPGKYELRANTTLTEAIAIAGGFTDASKHSNVQLYRRVDKGWTIARIIDVKKMHSIGTLTEDPYLHPGDMLFVPKNRFSKIRTFIPTTGIGAYAPIY
jgi:polysaccharide export outer membrane protein